MSNKLRFTPIALLLVSVTIFGAVDLRWFTPTAIALAAHAGAIAQSAPSAPQRISPQGVWQKVYELLPDFPKENQYISKETGKASTDNTLVGRFIRYHLYVKGRPPIYRFDWKLTMADYLGVNEIMFENVYPGGDTLRQNPMDNDRAAISRLTRAQRDALIDTLVSIFNPNAASPQTPPTAPTPSSSPTPNNRSLPNSPQPGDAQRLKL